MAQIRSDSDMILTQFRTSPAIAIKAKIKQGSDRSEILDPGHFRLKGFMAGCYVNPTVSRRLFKLLFYIALKP